MRSKVTAEAVIVEVAPGKFLFALLNGSDQEKRDATHWVYPAYQLSEAGSYDGAMMKLRSQPHDTPVPLPQEGWPMLVTFDDITKPETVREVDPEDLAAVFGEGVRLQAVTLEITREAVTEGRVEGVLGKNFFPNWAKVHQAELKKGAVLNNPYFSSFTAQMNRSLFIVDQ